MARNVGLESGSAKSKKLEAAPKLNGNHKTNGNGAIALQKSAHGKSAKIDAKADLLRAYHEMLRARIADLKTIVLYKQNKCHFQIGCSGHEAVGVAASQVFRSGKDWFYPYYREMALCAGLGMTNEEFMLNAMNKEADPNSHGRQMPMHYGHKNLRIVNQSSPTGTQFLQAVGCALGSVKLGEKEVTYVSSGEGTCSQGDFHEALNWAAREKLPVVFSIQNNLYAISVHVSEQLAGESVYELAAGYKNLARESIDGSDFAQTKAAFARAHARALKGDGPTLIEFHVPRLQSHSISDNHLKYRSKEDIDAEQMRCPIARLKALLIKDKIATRAELDEMEETLKKEMDAAAEWAEAQADPSPDSAEQFTYVNPNPADGVVEGNPTGEEIYLVDALNHALDEELKLNPKMLVFGQDVAHGKGGVFTVTANLTAKYGVERVFNAPLAESSIIGVAVGLATRGLKPVAEIQFGDYIWTGMMQLRNELAMMYYRSGGDFTCPAVIRVPVGGYIHGAAYHSQSIDGTFTHVPGVFVVYPSNAADAKGLLKAAIRAEDPVLFMEHKGLYRQVYAKGAEGDANCLVPIGKGKVVRPGSDLTIVTWGAIVNKSVLAAKELEKEGVSVEVIDLRTLVPLDIELVFESIRKTNRVLVAHEDIKFMGFGAEISAQIMEECFSHLDAPVKRVGMKAVGAIAHSAFIEDVVLPQNEDVLKAAREVLSY